MVGGSWPLMLNHFLATIFFQIDIVLLEWIKGARIVGLYRVAYSWLLAINVVPAFFTQALLPIMSRQARDNHAALRRTYTLGIKLLVAVAFPLAVGFTFLAEPLTWFLGGAAYLPDGAIALRIMIWSIPIGWMNSLTQYALVALDLQRRITVAFAVAVAFNVSANLLLIPAYGFQAAALTTIVSEIVLFVPFALLMQSKLGRLPWLAIIARPALAAGIMAGVTLLGWVLIHPAVGVAAGVIVYPLALLAVRPLSADEWRLLSPVIPGRARRWLPVAALK
jgi:O-antigen/teichoic acid export membrane protein